VEVSDSEYQVVSLVELHSIVRFCPTSIFKGSEGTFVLSLTETTYTENCIKI